MTGTRVIRADFADVDLVAELIAEAFHDLAVAAWLVPDPGDRAAVLPANFRLHVGQALVHGEIDLTSDYNAVAVWIHRDHAMPITPHHDTYLEAACGPYADQFRVLDEVFDRHHPVDQSHHHLAFLAVRPEVHGHGLGSALMRHHHQTLDEAGLPAYLEASSSRSRDLYRRHGYEVLDSPFRLPDGPPLWPMWRIPCKVSGERSFKGEI